MPPDGRMVCCDVSDEYTATARRYWAEAGVADRVDLRIAPAVETLDALRRRGPVRHLRPRVHRRRQVAAIPAYYERCVELVRPGGLITLDNVLWSGDVADPTGRRPGHADAARRSTRPSPATRACHHVMLAIADGMTLARKL